jgi:hypothetical protein
MKSKKTAIVLVTGDRNWYNRKVITRELTKVEKKYKILFVIQGGAPGADSQARRICEQLGITPVTVHALWDAQGKAAGPIRNQKMLELIDAWGVGPGGYVSGEDCTCSTVDAKIVLAFHSNIKRSKGTADMIRRAKNMGLKVKLVEG